MSLKLVVSQVDGKAFLAKLLACEEHARPAPLLDIDGFLIGEGEEQDVVAQFRWQALKVMFFRLVGNGACGGLVGAGERRVDVAGIVVGRGCFGVAGEHHVGVVGVGVRCRE